MSIETITVGNISVTGQLEYDLTNHLEAGTNITITSSNGKSVISSSGGGGTLSGNVNVENISVTSDIEISGDAEIVGTAYIGNVSTSHISTDTASVGNMLVTGQLDYDLTNHLEAGDNITITSSNGKTVITAGNVSSTTSSSSSSGSQEPVFCKLYRDSSNYAFPTEKQPPTRFDTFIRRPTASPYEFTTDSNFRYVNVATGGWYRITWSIGVHQTDGSNIRTQFKTFTEVRTTPTGAFSYDNNKDVHGGTCYLRGNNTQDQGWSTGSVLRYIPSGGGITITAAAMYHTATNFLSTLNPYNMLIGSYYMVEFVSSASET